MYAIMIYDRFQQESIDYINAGHSVIVSAPTGAGKTAIAEHVIETCIQNKQGVIYTAPIKALSNQKFRDFDAKYPGHIGILTGDVSINQDASVLIMTTEIFRNKILDDPESLKKYSWIIFDEIHYIDNPERGTVWEESLMFLPIHMNILALSATIPNIDEFAKWLESIHKKDVKVVIESKRPVPLRFYYQCHNRIIDSWHDLRRARERRPNKLASIISYMRDKDGLPCIYFVFGRKRAEDLAFELYSFDFLKGTEKDEVSALFADLCERFDLRSEPSAARLLPLVERGIAYHHAGMLPTLKEVIERLFASKLIKVIFTTETFALGINMPSRSVVFDELSKYYGRFIRCLKTRDFYQMAGRAGRRGMDKEGFVYSRVNLQRVRQEEVKRIIYGKPEEVHSQLNTSYATILSLYAKYRENLFEVYPLSFHSFQAGGNQQKKAVALMDSKLNLLKDWDYIKPNKLTDKGLFARAVCGYELLLSELYAEGVFEGLDSISLGMIAVSTVFEPRRIQQLGSIPKAARPIKDACEEIYQKIRHKEAVSRIYPFSKPAHFHLAYPIFLWMHNESFSKIIQHSVTDEGGLVRYFRMAIQILREIKDAPISPVLKDNLSKAIRLINRDVVDAEKQLREG